MKKLLFFMLMTISYASNCQITTWPSVDRSNCMIRKVTTTPDETTIVISSASSGYNSSNSWVRLNPNTWIEYVNPSNGDNEKSIIVKLTDEYNRQVFQLGKKYYGVSTVTLHFRPLPVGVNLINLIETNGWKVYGIHITPTSNNPIRRIAETEAEIKQIIDCSQSKHSGFYEMLDNDGYRLALLDRNDSIQLIYIGQDKGSIGTWKCGEVKAVLRPTAIKSIYKADYYDTDKIKRSAVITLDIASLSISVNNNSPDVYIRMGEISDIEQPREESSSEIWTGTGFALGNNYIITNNHVVGEAKVISVKGVQGDLSVGVSAELVATDKANDIAIVKITDNNFSGFGAIPYSISSTMANVGEEIFVLGYPLTQALGKEIKLTNGIVSSRTGYQGNISTYQISAPIQPGNSGGPLFDSNGDVIGIVVASVPGAENVSYAIKTSYLQILIESAGLNINFPNNNTISTLSLAEKIKRVKDFVFYIECSK